MANSSFQHSEAFLQWIWENVLFDFTSLQTTCGKKIHLLDPGVLNKSDGPDFKMAVLQVEDTTWYGDVEIHTESTQWNAHKHQKDPNFNSVILHVVTDNEPKSVLTKNGSTPYTLNLSPFLSGNLSLFLKNFNAPETLPCSASFNYISEDAFYQQIEKAHLEYFEKKNNDFLRFYNPDIPPSKAWKRALILSIWDGLGISNNRSAMQKTGGQLLERWDGKSVDEGIDLALEIAGFKNSPSEITWSYKSVRPANHPKNRIIEAVTLSHLILGENFKHFLTASSTNIWRSWISAASLKNSSRLEILFGTVFLPALYMLGNLYAHKKLCENVLTAWKHLKTPIPASLLKKFRSFKLNDKSFSKKLGSVHQFKSYCNAGKCSKCFVLKKAIES